MNEQILEELQLLAVSIYAGLVFILCYDVIRIFRRVFPASMARSIIEDVLFWTAAAIYLFQLFLRYNYGSPRYYGIGATALTMLIYEWLVGRRIINPLSNRLRQFLRILLKPLKKIRNGFKLVYHKVFQKKKKILRNQRDERINDVKQPTKKRNHKRFRLKKSENPESQDRNAESADAAGKKGHAGTKTGPDSKTENQK